MRRVQSPDLVDIIDFLYYGEANVYQENLDSFLVIAEELELKGLKGKKSSDMEKEDIASAEHVEIKEAKPSTAVAIPNQSDVDLEALDAKVKSMTEKSMNLVPSGKKADGTPKQATGLICKVCGKEGHPTVIKRHIGKHLKGIISIPCTFCDKVYSSMHGMRQHKSSHHKDLL